MEWTETLRRTVDCLEAHLLEEDAAERAVKEACLSPVYLQKGFKLVTGYSIAEYVRNRRLYLAGLEMIAGREKVIDLAYQYGYDTPESFSKAFSRFHGVSPAQLRQNPLQFPDLTVKTAQLPPQIPLYIHDWVDPYFQHIFLYSFVCCDSILSASIYHFTVSDRMHTLWNEQPIAASALRRY